MPLPSRIIGRVQVRSNRSFFARNILLPYKDFIRVQETAGFPLLLFTILAVVWANLGFMPDYETFWTTKIAFHFGDLNKTETIRKWINDFLLPLFFFVAGMEIKREMSQGALSTLKRAAMPAIAAFGGMLGPILTYLLFNIKSQNLAGWAVPVATDLAFTLSLLSLLGRRIPKELIIFALAFAAVDDIGGTLIIAFCYTHDFVLTGLIIAALFFAAIAAAKMVGIVSSFVYFILGVGFFLSIFISGIHPNIAAVVLGLLVPSRPCFQPDEFQGKSEELLQRLKKLNAPDALEKFDSESESPPTEQLETERDLALGQLEALVSGTQSAVDRLSRKVYPWTSYFVLPVFALANAGLTFSPELFTAALVHPTSLGVFFGLLLGKPLGIISAVLLAHKLKMAHFPKSIQFQHIVGLSIVAGIGFTISLFIAHLSFGNGEAMEQSKIAIFAASLLAAGIGFLYLFLIGRKDDG